MSLFNKKKDKNIPSPEGQKGDVGNFAGFALLNEPGIDKGKFIADLKADWGIDISDDSKPGDDIIYADIEGFRLVVGLIPSPVPDGEAEYWAKANYMWQNAEEITASHKAHAIIAILGSDDDPIKKGNVYVKAVCAMMKQENVIAFYNEGAVFSPKMYLDFAGLLKDGHVPVLNLVWMGIYGNGKMTGVYTYGMRRMGKEEMEVYLPAEEADLNELREFMLTVASYVLETGATLKHGETIGFTEEQRFPISIGKGIAVDGNSVLIGYKK